MVTGKRQAGQGSSSCAWRRRGFWISADVFFQVNWRNVEEVLMFADSNIQVGDDGGRGGSVGVGGCWWHPTAKLVESNCGCLTVDSSDAD